ncbi:hypothetical protein ADU20_26690 [Burkholderia pseudomallei]|nr:hypothetical protein ADU20_26690 [Burkholderia pseudomallei]
MRGERDMTCGAGRVERGSRRLARRARRIAFVRRVDSRARFAFRSDERAAIRSRHRIGGQVSRTHGATSQTVEAVRAKSIAFDGR